MTQLAFSIQPNCSSSPNPEQSRTPFRIQCFPPPDWLASGGGDTLDLSTRIKDAGIAIRHSRGRILFYTAGSRNGLEGLDGNGVRPKFMKKEFQIMKKGFASFQTRQKRRKRRYLGNYASKSLIFESKFDVRARRRLWKRPRAQKLRKK